jgi:hypothetical protein
VLRGDQESEPNPPLPATPVSKPHAKTKLYNILRHNQQLSDGNRGLRLKNEVFFTARIVSACTETGCSACENTRGRFRRNAGFASG